MTYIALTIKNEKAKFSVDELRFEILTDTKRVSIFASDKQLKEMHKQLSMYIEDKESE